MIYIGTAHNKETMAIVTNMNRPLGNMIGNALEIKEVMDILNNKGNRDLRELSVVISTYMVSMSKSISFADASKEVLETLRNGNAYSKFLEMIKYQGGDISNVKISANVVEIRSDKEGFVNNIDALKIGEASMKLGAGRKTKEDKIDYTVGIELIKNIGDYVRNRDIIAKAYINKVQANPIEIIEAFTIEKEFKEPEKLVFGAIK